MIAIQGRDGELRLIEYGHQGTTYYLEVLFCEMDFTVPLAKPLVEEVLILDRGLLDGDARYIEGPDSPRYGYVNLTFSCRLADTVNATTLHEWISGVTKISGVTQLYSWKGKTSIDGNDLVDFEDDSNKYAYRIEILWDDSNDYGIQCNEVYFPPDQQEIRESQDGLILSCNGLVYGGVTRITSFTSGPSEIGYLDMLTWQGSTLTWQGETLYW